ncbi:MAG: TolC family protein [Epsilonproteobacteria bacterium]|nr:TolC family protein [Campylobacterota bacterium]
MKKIILFLTPLLLWSATLKEYIKSIDDTPLVKSKEKAIKATKEMLEVSKAKNYPKVDLSFNAFRLKETPTTLFVFPPFPPVTIPLGTKDNVNLEIGFVYPLFSGYAITDTIEKSKLKVAKKVLEKDVLKRSLYLKAVELYGNIYALDMYEKALNEAKKAVEASLKKARGLYKNDLLNLSGVYNIEAKKFDIISDIQKIKTQKESLINDLAYICGIKGDEKFRIGDFKTELKEDEITDIAFRQRRDLQVLQKELKIANSDIKLAKSRYYPSIALVGAIKKQGDNLKLNGNGYTNADSSYIGLSVKWNLFDGFSRRHEKEAAMRKKEATLLYFNDYKNRVKTEIKNSFLSLKSLKTRLISAQKRVLAQKEYLKLTKGRFENSLCSADELSRAISSLATAKAKLQETKAKIFIQRHKIALEAGIEYFLKIVR